MLKRKRIQEIYFNFLLIITPVCCLLGNLSINVLIFFILLGGLFFFKTRLFKINLKENNLYIITLFFVFIILSTFFNLLQNGEHEDYIKSIFFLKYFLLILAVNFLLREGIINLKYLLLSSFICSMFVASEVIFQYFINKKEVVYNSTIFGEENIAGGYIQRFGVLGVLSLIIFFKNKKPWFNFFTLFLFLFYILAVILSGNRMPLIMFLLSLLLFGFFLKNFRIPILMSFLILSVVGSIFWSLVDRDKNLIKNRYLSFYNNAVNIIPNVVLELSKGDYPELQNKKDEPFVEYWHKGERDQYEIIPSGSMHVIVYITAIDLWKDSKLIGSGIKSFRVNCLDKLHLPNRVCSNHPHNYYLEIMNDSGLIGFALFVFAAILLLWKNLKLLNQRNVHENKVLFSIILSVLISFFVEIFPLRSAGSFFSTSSGFYIFLLFSILFSSENLLKKKI